MTTRGARLSCPYNADSRGAVSGEPRVPPDTVGSELPTLQKEMGEQRCRGQWGDGFFGRGG